MGIHKPKNKKIGISLIFSRRLMRNDFFLVSLSVFLIPCANASVSSIYHILMITKLLILLGSALFIEQNIPPAVSWFSYSLIGILIAQWVNLILLSCIVIGSSSLNSVLTWIVFWPLREKIRRYQQRSKYQDRISHMGKNVHAYFTKKKKLNRFNLRLERYTLTRTGKFMLFLCSILILASAIPDVFAVGATRKRLNLLSYTIAVILGKCLAYLPIILLGKSILHLINV